MKDLSPVLSSLGLLDSEIKTYLIAFEGGPGTVLELAKRTSLSRQAVYVAIDTLTSRGLMSSALRGKRRIYAAEPPSKLLAYAKRRDADVHDKVKELEQALPELELRAGGERPVVRVFEGREGIHAIIEDMRENKMSNVSELADTEAMYKVLTSDDLAAMRSALKKAGTSVRGIYWNSKEPPTQASQTTYLPKEFADFKANIGVYGDKVIMVTFEGKMHSVIVESKTLAHAVEILFSLAHKGMKK